MKAQEAFNELSKKLNKCKMENLTCRAEQNGYELNAVKENKPKMQPTIGPFEGFRETQGKCRQADKYNYDREHVYNLVNTLGNVVNTEQGCADYCSKDIECVAWQFYQRDPGAYDNCNIWTGPGYTGNGAVSSKCYLKNQ